MSITVILSQIQSELKAPKGQINKFGGYKYRSCEDIVEAAKPLLAQHDAVLLIWDELVQVGDRYYVKATAQVAVGKEVSQTTAYAREPESRKGMDESQLTGTASSYARKYALNGLFAIDDTKDADSNEVAAQVAAQSNVEGRAPDMTLVNNLVKSAKQIIDDDEMTLQDAHEAVRGLLKGVKNAEKEAFGELLKQDKHEFTTEKGRKTQRSYATTFRSLWDFEGETA